LDLETLAKIDTQVSNLYGLSVRGCVWISSTAAYSDSVSGLPLVLSGGSSGGAGLLVNSHHDGVELALELSLLLGHFVSRGAGLEELESVVGGLHDGLNVHLGEVLSEVAVLEGLSHLVAVVLDLVFHLDLLALGIILMLELLGVVDHLLDLLFGETSLIVSDSDALSLSGGLIGGGDVEDTIGINLKSDLNLRSTTGCGRDSDKVELSELMVISGHLTLTLENLNFDAWLVINSGGEFLHLLGGDGGVSGDDDGHDGSVGLNTLGKRGDIEEEEILDGLGTLTGEDGGLDGSTEGDGLIGVDGSVKLLAAEEVLEHGLDLGDSSGTTNKDDFVDLVLGDLGIGEDGLDGRHALEELGHAKLLELSTGDVDVEVLTIGESLTEDFRGMGGGQNSLGLLTLSSKTTKSSGVAGDVDAGRLLESGNAEVDKDVVEILTTEMGVTIGGLDLEDTILNLEEGDIESATTEIEDENVLLTLALFVETVSDSGSGGLVDDSLDGETSDGTGILGGLSLGVIEVSGDSDDSVVDGLSEVSLGDFLHLDEDHSGDLLSLELLGLTLEVDLDEGLLRGSGDDLERPEGHVGLDGLVAKLATDESLGIEDSVGGVSGGLVLGRVTDETLLLSEGDVRGGGVDTLIVGDNFDLVVLPHTDARVGGSEIDSDCWRGHCFVVFLF